MKKNILLYLSVTAIITICCSKHEVIPDPVVVETKGLKEVSPFPFGASLNISLLKSRVLYQNVIRKEFNSVTAENAMKIGSIHPSENTYYWDDADYLVTFAKSLNIRVHGHTLIWHNSLPSWVTGFQGDAAAWEDLFKTHIQTVVTHFKGSVTSWDVVNEAFNDDGTLRSTIWSQHLGNDYVARAFQYAHLADPDALLFYNEYGHEYSSAKRTAVNNMVADFKARGIPVHGLGLQMHTNQNQTDANLIEAISTAAQTGLKIHISELDISLNQANNQSLVLTDALSALQAAKYKVIVKTFAALPAAQRYGITTWNVGDADSWIRSTYNRPDWPLPFDDNYNRKPAYQGILDGLN
ncbi:MAG: endo-1,4-beta-xylanase [Bacteroidia bacterium]|nr:endo-1,4-beta-xylanase [Bacteroidia bacterium]